MYAYRGLVRKFQLEVLEHLSQGQFDLQQGEPHSDAAPRSLAERKVRVRMSLLLLLLCKPEHKRKIALSRTKSL